MAVSDNPLDGRTERGRTGVLDSLTRYDLVLAVIPVIFLVAVMLGNLFAVPVRVGLATGGLVSGLAVADALFFNPPTRPGGK